MVGGLLWLLLGVFHQGAERYMAIDNVCAWPNLTLMPDGSVVATIFNRPYHQRYPMGAVRWVLEKE